MVASFLKKRNAVKKIWSYLCAESFMKTLQYGVTRILLFSPFLLIACTPQKTPPLPDLDQPSISYDSTVQEADQLKKQVEQMAAEQDSSMK